MAQKVKVSSEIGIEDTPLCRPWQAKALLSQLPDQDVDFKNTLKNYRFKKILIKDKYRHM
jgi:hypothetical protein